MNDMFVTNRIVGGHIVLYADGAAALHEQMGKHNGRTL
jgi:hypothetical protein